MNETPMRVSMCVVKMEMASDCPAIWKRTLHPSDLPIHFSCAVLTTAGQFGSYV